MNETLDYKHYWDQAMSYEDYRALITDLLAEGKTTGSDQSEKMVAYGALNDKRMSGLDKRYTPSETLLSAMKKYAGAWGVLVITEGWCGDAAQIVPVITKAADAAGVALKVILRDEHPALIDAHLTNGGRSIPIILFIELATAEVKGIWGPRPQPAQKMVMDYKAAKEPKPPYSEFVKEVQLWYAKDKQQTMEQEWMALI